MPHCLRPAYLFRREHSHKCDESGGVVSCRHTSCFSVFRMATPTCGVGGMTEVGRLRRESRAWESFDSLAALFGIAFRRSHVMQYHFTLYCTYAEGNAVFESKNRIISFIMVSQCSAQCPRSLTRDLSAPKDLPNPPLSLLSYGSRRGHRGRLYS